MDDLDEDVERGVARDDHFGALGEKRVDDRLEARLSRRVRLAFDSNHVNLRAEALID